jgi:hypothetical protein
VRRVEPGWAPVNQIRSEPDHRVSVVLEEPHPRLWILGKHFCDLLGVIEGHRHGSERSMRVVVVPTTRGPHPERSVDAEQIEVGDATGKRGLLDLGSQTLAVQQDAGAAGARCAFLSNGFEQGALRPPRDLDAVKGKETWKQSVADRNRYTVAPGQELDYIDGSRIGVSGTRWGLHNEERAIECTGASQFGHCEFHPLFDRQRRIQTDEDANGLGHGIASRDESDVVVGCCRTHVPRTLASNIVRTNE